MREIMIELTKAQQILMTSKKMTSLKETAEVEEAPEITRVLTVF